MSDAWVLMVGGQWLWKERYVVERGWMSSESRGGKQISHTLKQCEDRNLNRYEDGYVGGCLLVALLVYRKFNGG